MTEETNTTRGPVSSLANVGIRGVRPADYEFLFALATDIESFFWWDDGHLETIQERFVETLRMKAETRTYLIVEDPTKNQLLGVAYIYSLDPVNGWAYYTVALADDARRRGVGTTATQLVVDFSFFTWNLAKVYIEIIGSNAPAIACALKLGFRREGCLRGHRVIDGKRLDVHIYAVTRRRWQTVRRQFSTAR